MNIFQIANTIAFVKYTSKSTFHFTISMHDIEQNTLHMIFLQIEIQHLNNDKLNTEY
jgi:hypothetical protein